MKNLLVALSYISLFASPAAWSANFDSLKDGDIISGTTNIVITTSLNDNLHSIFMWTQFYWPIEVGGGVENPNRFSLPAKELQVHELDTTQLRNGEHTIAVCDVQVQSDGTGSCDSVKVIVSNADTIAPQLIQSRPGVLVRPDETIFGIYALTAHAKDESGIQEILFLRDEGVLLGTLTLPLDTNINTYLLDWDTTSVDNGYHHFYMEAIDNQGNVASTRDGTLLYFNDIVPVPPRYVENRYTPNNVYARAKGYKVNVVWQGSEQEERYTVYRQLDNETSFSLVGEVTDPVFVDNLPTSTRYAEYYVTAVYRFGESDSSETIKITPALRTR